MRALIALLAVTACAGPPRSPAPRTPAESAAPAPSSPSAVSSAPRSTPDPLAAVPPAPDTCRSFARASARPRRACGGQAEALAKLERALGAAHAERRDAALGELEPCTEFAPGLLVALRAELAPAECGDYLVAEYPKAQTALENRIRDTLLGLSVAAKLTRLVRSPPELEPPHTKQRVQDFIRGAMADWVTTQAQAIGVLSRRGSRFGGYGKGIVAVEAGMADMRFVEVFRRVPLPEELGADQELRDAYYSSLDQGLEPRKDRGRDAALVGLKLLGEVGVLHDTRVEQARQLLSQLYNGRRIDALDGLLLPGLPPARPQSIEERLAAELPTFYADSILRAKDAKTPGLLRALLARGLPASLRAELDRKELGPEAKLLYARGLFELGRTYWRRAEFGRARAVALGRGSRAGDAALLAALGLALEQGPGDAAQMMLEGPMPRGVGNVSELDSLARAPNPTLARELAGMAAYDAAFIRELVPPVGKDAGFFRDLAVRYARAATLLTTPAERKLAQDRAHAAAETARSVR